MLVVASAVVLVMVAVTLPRVRRARRRARVLSSSLAHSRAEVLALLVERDRLGEEAGRLSAPERRLLRLLRHPLVGALFRSYRIRRRRHRG
jgi:hypothetical protein